TCRRKGNRVRRRTFVLLVAGATTAWGSAFAGAANPRVGFIGIGTRESNQHLLATFRDGLRALEWTDDSITILDRWAEEQGEQLPSIASDLIGSGVEILVTIGNSATLAVARATKSLPIIFVGVGNPRALGLMDDLAHPGGNATGLSRNSSSLIGERFRL